MNEILRTTLKPLLKPLYLEGHRIIRCVSKWMSQPSAVESVLCCQVEFRTRWLVTAHMTKCCFKGNLSVDWRIAVVHLVSLFFWRHVDSLESFAVSASVGPLFPPFAL